MQQSGCYSLTQRRFRKVTGDEPCVFLAELRPPWALRCVLNTLPELGAKVLRGSEASLASVVSVRQQSGSFLCVWVAQEAIWKCAHKNVLDSVICWLIICRREGVLAWRIRGQTKGEPLMSKHETVSNGSAAHRIDWTPVGPRVFDSLIFKRKLEKSRSVES